MTYKFKEDRLPVPPLPTPVYLFNALDMTLSQPAGGCQNGRNGIAIKDIAYLYKKPLIFPIFNEQDCINARKDGATVIIADPTTTQFLWNLVPIKMQDFVFQSVDFRVTFIRDLLPKQFYQQLERRNELPNLMGSNNYVAFFYPSMFCPRHVFSEPEAPKLTRQHSFAASSESDPPTSDYAFSRGGSVRRSRIPTLRGKRLR